MTRCLLHHKHTPWYVSFGWSFDHDDEPRPLTYRYDRIPAQHTTINSKLLVGEVRRTIEMVTNVTEGRNRQNVSDVCVGCRSARSIFHSTMQSNSISAETTQHRPSEEESWMSRRKELCLWKDGDVYATAAQSSVSSAVTCLLFAVVAGCCRAADAFVLQVRQHEVRCIK